MITILKKLVYTVLVIVLYANIANAKTYDCEKDVICQGVNFKIEDIAKQIVEKENTSEKIEVLFRGKKYLEIPIKSGKIEGIVNVYGDHGKLWKQRPYENGKINGIEKVYYEQGQLWEENPYVNGELEGTRKSYSTKGILTDEVPYLHNKEDGTAKLYYNDGKIKEEIFYDNGKMKISKRYYQNGFLGSEFNHDTNEIKNFVYYLQNGKIIKKNILRKKINPNDWNVTEATFESYDADDNLTIRRKAKEEDFIWEAEPIGFKNYIENPIIRIP